MKTLILSVLIGVGGLMAILVCLNQRPALTVSPPGAAEPLQERAAVAQATVEPAPAPQKPSDSLVAQPRAPSPHTESNLARHDLDGAVVSLALETLVSSQTAYHQKQATWKELRDAGKLDQVISELEQRMTAQPQAAEFPAALGQAYLKKCSTLQDIREQAMLAMQADKAFDTALMLDPANWEARFTKAVGMSFWPAGLNKEDEVIEQLHSLILQQETQPPQPHFAETYLWLGNQYQKTGRTDDAQAIWERGAQLFPGHGSLRNKLATTTAATMPAAAAR